MNARERFLKLVTDSGWTLDPGQTIALKRWSPERKQNPHAFLLPGDNGEVWHILLDYTVSDGWSSHTGNSLKSIHIDLMSGKNTYIWRAHLKNGDRSQYNQGTLWDALERDAAGNRRTFMKRAEALVANPALAAWLTGELEYKNQLKREARDREQERLDVLRAQPLPITISGRDFRIWAARLQDAATAVRRADGLTDLPQELANVQIALDALVDGLTDEASLEFGALAHPELAEQTNG